MLKRMSIKCGYERMKRISWPFLFSHMKWSKNRLNCEKHVSTSTKISLLDATKWKKHFQTKSPRKSEAKNAQWDLVGQWNFDRHSFESSCLIHERSRHGENKVLARKWFGIFVASMASHHILDIACYLMSCTRTQKATFRHIMYTHSRSMNEQSVQQVYASPATNGAQNK